MVSIIVPIVTLLITYIVLFVIAIFTNSGLGSPIALPLWFVFVFLVSALYTAVLLFPSVLIAETVSRIFGKWQHIAQIPVSSLALVLLVYILSLLVHSYPDYSAIPILNWAEHPFIVVLVLAIPLGIYWWTMKVVQTGIFLPIIFFERLRKPSHSKVS